MNARDKAVEAVHSRICEESLSEHMDPMWPGRCVKAVQAAAPHLTANLEKYKRGAKTLGEIIDKQSRDVLDVTGLHHLINEDGDGHWDAVWMRLHEMRDELADLKESTIARERKRGDSWRDRAQEFELCLEVATARADAAEKTVQRVRHLLDATDPNRYAILSMEGLRIGIRSALAGEGGPA